MVKALAEITVSGPAASISRAQAAEMMNA